MPDGLTDGTLLSMQMLYESPAFVVVHIDANEGVEGVPPRPGFEIVDKRTNTEVYLDGPWAAVFQGHINAWLAKTPEQELVEQVLDSYCQLANNPLIMH